MRKNLFLIFVIVLFGCKVYTQPEGYSKVADSAYILQKINEVASQTNSINTEFIQEKNLSFLYEKIISKGILLYEKPEKLRLEYLIPFRYLLIMNDGKLLIRNNDKETKIALESSTMFNEINDLIINSIQGRILSMPEMSALFYENDEAFYVQLWPRQEELRKYIKTIELYISKNDYTVTDFRVIELSDDYTQIKFVNKKINEEIPAGSFTF
jgi:outer membrane lipoprotein-sorting protein